MECGKMWQIFGRYGERLIHKANVKFCPPIVSKRKVTFLAKYFDAKTKSIRSSLTNCGCWVCGKMFSQLGTCGVCLPNKPYNQVRKSIITNRKLTFKARAQPTVSVAKCGEMWQNVDRYGELFINKAND